MSSLSTLPPLAPIYTAGSGAGSGASSGAGPGQQQQQVSHRAQAQAQPPPPPVEAEREREAERDGESCSTGVGNGNTHGNGNSDGGNGGNAGQQQQRHTFTDAQIDEYKEQDRYLPIANVGRIMKAALPDNAKIAKEAKECVQECVSEFISFLSSEAAEKVLTDKRKTINGEDILYSMTSLGFDNYAEACKVYLAKYRSRQLNQEPSTLSYRTSLALTTSHRASPASATDQTRISAAQTQTGGSSPDSDSDDPHPGAHTTATTTNGNNAKGKGKKRAAPAVAQPLTGGINSSSVVRSEEEDELSENGEDDSAGAGGGGKRRKLVQPAQYQLPRPGAGQAPPSSRS